MTALYVLAAIAQVFLLALIFVAVTHRNRRQREHSFLKCENNLEAYDKVYQAECRGWSVQSFSVQPDGSWHIVLYR